MKKRLAPKQVRKIFWIAFLVGAVVGGAGFVLSQQPLSAVGLVILAGDIIFYLACYRCPHCGKYLDRSTGPYCPQCGQKIYDTEG